MKIYILTAMVFLSTISQATNWHPTKGGDNGIIVNFNVQPGDTISLTAAQNPYSYFYMNKDGNGWGAGHQITIINEGGLVQMTSGFSLENCQYVVITGTGFAGQFWGFRIHNGNVAVSVFGKTSHIKFDHITVDNMSQSAFWVKNEISCDTTLNYPNWVIDDIEISYIHATHLGGDGAYIGSTAPTGGRNITCGGQVKTTYIPSRLSNVTVRNCFFDTCWRQALQLSGVDAGSNYVYADTIKHTGVEFHPCECQGVGLYIGGMTANIEIYDCIVDSTLLQNYVLSGVGTEYFHDNFGGHPGRVYSTYWNGYATNVFVKNPFSLPSTQATFIIRDNDLNDKGTGGNNNVGVLKIENYTDDNVVCNSGVLGSSPGVEINTTTACDDPTPPNCTTNIAPPDNETDQDTALLLEWAAATDATSYDIYFGAQGGAISFLANTTGTTYNITGLAYNTTYTWYIVPTNAEGDATGCIDDSTNFTTASNTGCPSPEIITVVNLQIHNAQISWTEVDDATGYDMGIKDQDGGGSWITVLSNSPNTSYQFTQLKNNNKYKVRVRARCGGDNSAYVTKLFKTLQRPRASTVIRSQ